MVGRGGRTVGRLMSMGIKYGPLAYAGLRGRRPARGRTRQTVTRRHARTIALEHAAHLRDGSVLPVYSDDVRVWIVFSGDTPVGSHPTVETPYEDLLAHYDLATRIRPARPGSARASARPEARRAGPRDAAGGDDGAGGRSRPPGGA